MFRHASASALLLVLAACGRSDEEALRDAANQSDPAAAAVLNNAAEAGVDPQQALEQAGQAAAANGTNEASEPASGTLQAKPNRVQDPNRPEGGQPPEKVQVNTQ